LIIFCFLQAFFSFAEVQTYWDYGEFELAVTFGKDADLNANLEFFVNCSTLNPMNIKYVSFRAGTEISLAAGLPDKVEADLPCIGKAVSLETGVFVSNRDWRDIKYYVALDFNFAFFVYLWKNETCN
jgi:hypothetical protein